MKINSAILISTSTLFLGFFFNQPYLWISFSVLGAGFIDLFTRQWVMSDRIGSAKNLSMFIKFFFSLVGFYAMLGQIVCVGLLIWWFVL